MSRLFAVRPITAVILSGAMLFGSVGLSAADTADWTWPQWRGGNQDGVAEIGGVPVSWQADARGNGQGIAWKTDLPGRGGSTPVIADGKAFLTAGFDGYNHLLAIDVAGGKIRWDVKAGEDQGNKHQKGSGSNPSAVTDGDLVYAYFRSGDLVCVNTAGEKKWSKNLQDMYASDTLWWDLGNSPVLTDHSVIVVVMQSDSDDKKGSKSLGYLVSFDKISGDILWKADRNTDAVSEAAQSYTTPVLVDVDGTAMIAVMGADHATLHRVDNGEMVGDVGGFNPDENMYNRSISSPVVTAGVLICPYNRGETVTGIDLQKMAAGLGRDAIAWHRDDLGSDVPTPAAKDGVVYFIEDGKADPLDRGTVAAIDAKTGKTLWTVATPKSRVTFSSSPLIADDHLYVTAENARTFVIGPLASRKPELVSTNDLADEDGITVASPVPVPAGLLIRTRESLYRIGD